MINEEALSRVIFSILRKPENNVNLMSAKMIRLELEKQYKKDLSKYHEYIKKVYVETRRKYIHEVSMLYKARERIK
jgi:hypothetical protein